MEIQDFYCDFILNNKVNFKKIEETGNVLAFYHTKPSYKKHIVVVPKIHISDLREAEDLEIIKEIFSVIRVVVEKLKLINYKVINNNGKYQDSKHLHFHIISD